MNSSAQYEIALDMSRLRAESRVDPSSWNASVRACHGTVFHAAQWAQYVQTDQPGAHPVFYSLLDDDGSVAGVALGFRVTSSRRLAASFTGRRWLDALPAVRDNSSTNASRLIRLIESHARQAGDVFFQVGSFASPNSDAVMKSLGFSISRRYEFELDLTKDEKTLWERIDFRRRQRIRKAMKSGVEVKELPADEGVSHLRRLQAESWVRIVARGGPIPGVRESAGEDHIAILTREGLGRIIGGFLDGVCVSAGFFTSFNGVAYYTLSGHDAKALESQAPSLVLWEMALRFKGEGIQRLNFGGCGVDALEESSPEHGVYIYKKSFGGAILECASGEKVLRPAIRRAANLLRAAIG
jgi:peptidoglycan biosynthesis/recognition FemAB-like protein